MTRQMMLAVPVASEGFTREDELTTYLLDAADRACAREGCTRTSEPVREADKPCEWEGTVLRRYSFWTDADARPGTEAC